MTHPIHTFEGTCHCQAIGFAFHTAVPVGQWGMRTCECTFCQAHGPLYTSDPAGKLEFFEREAGLLNRYRFGTRNADFMLCARCGVYVGARMESEDRAFGIINIRALRPIPRGLPEAKAMNYDGEAGGERTQRWEARWTPIVQ